MVVKGKGDGSTEEMVKDQERSPGEHLTEPRVVCNTNEDRHGEYG